MVKLTRQSTPEKENFLKIQSDNLIFVDMSKEDLKKEITICQIGNISFYAGDGMAYAYGKKDGIAVLSSEYYEELEDLYEDFINSDSNAFVFETFDDYDTSFIFYFYNNSMHFITLDGENVKTSNGVIYPGEDEKFSFETIDKISDSKLYIAALSENLKYMLVFNSLNGDLKYYETEDVGLYFNIAKSYHIFIKRLLIGWK